MTILAKYPLFLLTGAQISILIRNAKIDTREPRDPQSAIAITLEQTSRRVRPLFSVVNLKRRYSKRLVGKIRVNENPME